MYVCWLKYSVLNKTKTRLKVNEKSSSGVQKIFLRVGVFEILNKNFISNTPSRDYRIFSRKISESGSRSANRSYPDVGFVFVTLNESGYEWNLKLDAYQKQDPDPFESPSLSRLKDLINSWVEYYFVKENLIIS